MTSKILIFIALGWLCASLFLPFGSGDESAYDTFRWALGTSRWVWPFVCAFLMFPLFALPILVLERVLRNRRARSILGWIICALAVVAVAGSGRVLQIVGMDELGRENEGGEIAAVLATSSMLLGGALVLGFLCVRMSAELRVPIVLLGYGVAITGFCVLVAIFGGRARVLLPFLSACVLLTLGAVVDVVQEVKVLRERRRAEAETPPVEGTR